MDQIAQQLRLGKLETEENQDLSSPFQTEEHKFSDRQLEAQVNFEVHYLTWVAWVALTPLYFSVGIGAIGA